MAYYSTIKWNELSIHMTWMDLKSIMLNEKSQSPKVTYYEYDTLEIAEV
jgi:hypothetical protein